MIFFPMRTIKGDSSLSEEQKRLPIGHSHAKEPGHSSQEEEERIASMIEQLTKRRAAASSAGLLTINVIQSLVDPKVQSHNKEHPVRGPLTACHLRAIVCCHDAVAGQK
jgi:hypothetical protein